MVARLRVGLLVDSVSLPAWAFTAIQRMVTSDHAELVLIVLNQSGPARHFNRRAFCHDPGHYLYRVFNFIDEKLFLRAPNALIQVDAAEMFSNVPEIEAKPVNNKGEQHFLDSDVEAIRSYQPDILVKIGFGKLQGDILSVATYGVWTYRWGDPCKIDDGLTGFWEVVRGWPETGATLQQLGTDAEPHVILSEAWFFTYPYSPARNRNYILWSAASFLPRQVERLHRLGGEKYFQEIRSHSDENPQVLKFNDLPSNLMVLWITAKLAIRNILEVYHRSFYRERWELLFGFDQDAESDFSVFRKISPPRDRFWADPHLVYKEPNFYIFIEEYLYRTRRGRISVIEMDRKGNYKQPVPVLQEDYHLSFPFVFDWMGRYYMIPESSEKKTIDLYECIQFPDLWQLKMTLMKDVRAVDTTVFYTKEKWWLFTGITGPEPAHHVELFLFYSNELFTDQWKPHPMNPIISDVKRARGAGRIFLKEGTLIRPSQDCSRTYGYGFDLNEIVTLSESRYHERTVTSIRPDPLKRIFATHSYANQGGLTVVDTRTRPPKWA